MDPLTILFEDNHLLVVQKPVFMLSQADRTGKPDMISSLQTLIKVRDAKPGNVFVGLIHRLDQPVGGVMVFAKTSKAAARLSDQFRTHSVAKYYLAVCHGRVEDKPQWWSDYLSTKTKNGRYQITDREHGRAAHLIVQALAYDASRDVSLIHIKLLTGRSHQIRLQCQSRQHPLVGDRRYGANLPIDLQTPSIALFAERVTFQHPVKREPCTFSAIPDLPVFQSFAVVNEVAQLRASSERLADYQNAP